MKGVQKIYDIEEIFNESSLQFIDCLIFPRRWKESIYDLTHANYETGGAIIYRPQQNFFICEYYKILNDPQSAYCTGKYDSQKVKDFVEIIEKCRQIDGFCNLNLVWFHCHTVATGEYWYDKFSSGDLQSFSKENSNYQHVLFTPTKILTYSEKPLAVSFAHNYQPEINNKYDKWEKIFDLMEAE